MTENLSFQKSKLLITKVTSLAACIWNSSKWTFADSPFKEQQENGKQHLPCQALQGTVLQQETSAVVIHSLNNPPQAAGDKAVQGSVRGACW